MTFVLVSYRGPAAPSLILVAAQEEGAPGEQEQANRQTAERTEAASASPPFPEAGLSSDGGRFEAKSHAEFGTLQRDWVSYLLN